MNTATNPPRALPALPGISFDFEQYPRVYRGVQMNIPFDWYEKVTPLIDEILDNGGEVTYLNERSSLLELRFLSPLGDMDIFERVQFWELLAMRIRIVAIELLELYRAH